MAAPDLQAENPPPAARRRLWPRKPRGCLAGGATAALLLAGSSAWIGREQIAANVIDDYLAAAGVPATYDIIAIGPREQVIANLVVGDPVRPDFTARRVVIEVGLGWAGPQIERVTLDGARAFASYRDGTFSLGALDPLVFAPSDSPPALPAIDLVLRDARALVESDYGRVGLRLEGAGVLDDGFAGTLAATAPGIGAEGCRAETASLFGRLTTADGAARFEGPLRLADAACGGARLARADIGTALGLARDFSAAEGDAVIKGSALTLGEIASKGVSGTARMTWSKAGLVLAHDLAMSDLAAPQGGLEQVMAEGRWRGAGDASRGQWEGRISASGIAPTGDLDTALAAAARGLAGTLLAPLLERVRGGLAQGLPGASLTADAIIRHKPGNAALIVPEAALTTRSGTRIAALSQLSARIADGVLAGLSGNVIAGGEGLPNLNGRLAQEPDGGWNARLAMADYAAGANRLAIPNLLLRQARGGPVHFEGLVSASGDLPGGAVRDLALPLEGTWSQGAGLALGTACTPVRFAALSLSGLALKGQRLTLCPETRGAPMLAYGDTLRLGATSGPVSLAGQLGASPAILSADALRLRYPAPFAIDGILARIGAPGSMVQLAAASLTGSLAGEPAGTFAGGSAQIDAVPFDLGALTGRWAYDGGALRVGEGAFTLTDRPAQGLARFAALAADGAGLILEDNRITADATLRHPGSGRAVTKVAITHDLTTARGRAEILIPGVVFDEALQPRDLSTLAKGVIAFANGTITGAGAVDWSAETVTSRGRLGSDGFDFAAAFGPVRGLKGEVVFTDLLALTTAPDQRVTIAAINPGVEVLSGTVRFDLTDGTRLALRDARFPFMGGILQLRPLEMDFSQPEERRYIFDITGLDAAVFVAQMELTNLGATGTFDGTVPIVFDAAGNGRIEAGDLMSRPGGGTVAYIGELSYENLGAMGNYAFAALRALDYRQMRVGLSGNLAGEIITNFDFDGVRQGAGTSQNFVTRRIARLPIRFKVNVRSENFHELATMVRSFWNADFLGNPVDRGLLTTRGGRFVPAVSQPVQPPESEPQP